MDNISSRERHIIKYNAVASPDGSNLHNDGDVYWYNELGEIHREDGPSIRTDKSPSFLYPVAWYLNDINYSFNEWLKLTPITDEQKLLLRLQYA
jgi:hypothetical protein